MQGSDFAEFSYEELEKLKEMMTSILGNSDSITYGEKMNKEKREKTYSIWATFKLE